MLRNVRFYFNFQIDKDAVNVMGEKDLVELGLIAKGDRIKLRSFCKRGIDISSDREAKIAKIQEMLCINW